MPNSNLQQTPHPRMVGRSGCATASPPFDPRTVQLSAALVTLRSVEEFPQKWGIAAQFEMHCWRRVSLEQSWSDAGGPCTRRPPTDVQLLSIECIGSAGGDASRLLLIV